MLFRAIRLALTDRHGLRHKQGLAANTLAGMGSLHAFVDDAFVGRMHIHQHQARFIFRQNIDAV